MKYTGIERKVASLLSSFPKLKARLKSVYQKTAYGFLTLVLRKKENSSAALGLCEDNTMNYFFGYYGKPQINENGTVLLCATDIGPKMPSPYDRLRLLYGNVDERNYEEFATSYSWNWQQGCMLQWLPNIPGEALIYNNFHKGSHISIMYDIHNGVVDEFGMPIYAVSKDGKFALTLNFSRLYLLNPAYGYCNDVEDGLKSMAPDDDGIWLMNLESGKTDLILSLKQLSEFFPKPSMKKSYHKVNHIEISPGKSRFMFLHRWIYNDRKYTRLLTANIDGSGLFNLSDYDMVSHCTWKNNNQILSWARHPSFGDRYYLFTDLTGDCAVVGNNILSEDGHPSFSPDLTMILTDTYPDKLRMRSLILYKADNDERIILGRFFAPMSIDKEIRCDLHPRWSADGKFITFDSVHNGQRSSFIIDLKEVANM